MDYLGFVKIRLDKLIPIQNKFKEEFSIDSYKNWSYDSDSSLLRLYNNETEEIFFKYIPIGTFSNRSDTWMWTWFNGSAIEPHKNETLRIKRIGDENNYSKLINGSFKSDKYDPWEFLSIALDILGGIGVYRLNHDSLEEYLLILESVEKKDNPEIIKLKQKKVECDKHGLGRPAFVCQHLNLQVPKGFEEAFNSYFGMDLVENDDFQAWCDECEKLRIRCEGWNDESMEFAKIRVVCENCYFELKEFNMNS